MNHAQFFGLPDYDEELRSEFHHLADEWLEAVAFDAEPDLIEPNEKRMIEIATILRARECARHAGYLCARDEEGWR